MNVLIVGANGFLAEALAKELSIKGEHSLTGVYNQSRHRIPNHLYQNILPANQISQLPDHFDWVFLLAAFVPQSHTEDMSAKLKESNFDLVQNVCSHFKKGCIIFASSVSVFSSTHQMIDEKTSPQPVSAYGKSKNDGEAFVMKMNKHAIIRFSSLYGTSMRPATFLPRLVAQAQKDKKIVLWGTGERRQDYLHVSDAAQMLMRAAQKDENGTYLGVYGRSYSNLALAEKVAHWAGDIPIEHLNEDKSPSFLYDARWSHAQLNYQPQISIEEGLKELFNHE